MQLGELFFSLGFKSKGFKEAKDFNKLVKEAKSGLDQMASSLSKVSEVTTTSIGGLNKAFKETNPLLDRSVSIGMVLKNIFSGIVNVVTNLTKGFLAAGAAVLYFLKSSSDIAMTIDKLSAATGVTIGKLYNMKKFAAENGVEFDSMASSLERVIGIAQDIRIGKLVPSRYYQMLQIDPMATYEKQLEQLSAALKRHPDLQQALAGARDLGFTKDDIYIAQTVAGIYEKLNKKIGKPDDHSRMVKFSKDLAAFWERMRVSIGGLLLHAEPLITSFLKTIEDFVNEIKKLDPKEFDKFIEDFLKDPLKAVTEKIKQITAFIKAQVTEIMNIIDNRLNLIFDKLEKRIDAQIERIKSIFGIGSLKSENDNKPEKMFPSVFGKRPDGTTPIIKPTMDSPLKPALEKIKPIIEKIKNYFNPTPTPTPSPTPTPTPTPTPMPTPSSRLRFPGTQIYGPNSGVSREATPTPTPSRLRFPGTQIYGPNSGVSREATPTPASDGSFIDNNWMKDDKGNWLSEQQMREKIYNQAKERQKSLERQKSIEKKEPSMLDNIKDFLKKAKKASEDIFEKTKESSKEIFNFNKSNSDSNYYQPQWVPRKDKFEPDMPKKTPDSQKYMNPKNKNSDMPVIFNIEINEAKDPRHTAEVLKQTFSKTYWQMQRGEQ